MRQATLIFLDWDDTVFPTTHYALRTKYPLSPKSLYSLETSVLKTLQHLFDVCDDPRLVVLTNSRQGWVETTSKAVFPRLYAFIHHQAQIVSARALFEAKDPQHPVRWKCQAMADLAARHMPDQVSKVVSFGDSDYERQGLKKVLQTYPQVVGKSVKFSRRSSVNALVRQWNMLRKQWAQLYSTSVTVDLGFIVTKLDNDATPMLPKPTGFDLSTGLKFNGLGVGNQRATLKAQ